MKQGILKRIIEAVVFQVAGRGIIPTPKPKETKFVSWNYRLSIFFI